MKCKLLALGIVLLALAACKPAPPAPPPTATAAQPAPRPDIGSTATPAAVISTALPTPTATASTAAVTTPAATAAAAQPAPSPTWAPVLVVYVPPTQAPPYASGATLDLFNWTNQLRAQNNLPAYRLAPELNASALRHSNEMADTGNVDYAGPDGSTVAQRIADTGYGNYATGETIYGGVVTNDQFWKLVSTRPNPLANLLSTQFTDMGVGVVKGTHGLVYYTIDFGARPGASQPDPVVTPVPSPAPVIKPAADVPTPGPQGAAEDLMQRTNTLRVQNSLPPYRWASELQASSERMANDMANTNNYSSHTASDGSTVSRRAADAGYGSWPVGENIFGGQTTVDDAWGYWSTDPPHLQNLLNTRYYEIGISVVKQGRQYFYVMDLGGRSVPPTPAPPPPPPPPPAPPYDPVADLLGRMNALRAQNGLPAYRLSSRLTGAAAAHSQDMANTSLVTDAGSDGTTPKQRVLDTGYGDWPVGEIVMGGGGVTTDDAWARWLQDAGANASLLSTQYHDVGISVVKGESGTYYYTIVFGGK